MRRARALAICITAISAITAATFGACSIYDSSLLLSAPHDASTPNAGDAGILDGSVDATFASQCAHRVVPAMPAAEDGTDDVDFVVAATYLRFLANDDAGVAYPGPPVGFDLDGVCTCPQPESCVGLPGTTHCDDDGGTDNSAGAVFTSFALIAPSKFTDTALNKDLILGQTTVLLRIKSYNGGLNDKQVTAIVYASNGIDGVQDGGKSIPPTNNGSDVWTLDPSSLVSGATVDSGTTCEGNDNVCIPLFADTEAYVSNGVVVAHLDFPITVGANGDQFVVKLSGTVLTADIGKNGGLYTVEQGQVAGRWNTAGFLTSIATIRDPLNSNDYLCGDSGTYQNVKTISCRAQDVATNASSDNTGAPCDALSIALSFSAIQAHIGPIYAAPKNPGGCGAAWTDNCDSVQ